jgi:hypothetical protein
MATYQDLINDARVLLQDTEDDRFTDDVIISVLNRGLKDLGRIRPDAFYDFYDSNSLNVPTVTVTSPAPAGQTLWTEDFGIEGQFYTPLLAYIVGTVELTDDEFTVDGRAMMLLGQFRANVLGL